MSHTSSNRLGNRKYINHKELEMILNNDVNNKFRGMKRLLSHCQPMSADHIIKSTSGASCFTMFEPFPVTFSTFNNLLHIT